jgi:hypothetical protein
MTPLTVRYSTTKPKTLLISIGCIVFGIVLFIYSASNDSFIHPSRLLHYLRIVGFLFFLFGIIYMGINNKDTSYHVYHNGKSQEIEGQKVDPKIVKMPWWKKVVFAFGMVLFFLDFKNKAFTSPMFEKDWFNKEFRNKEYDKKVFRRGIFIIVLVSLYALLLIIFGIILK